MRSRLTPSSCISLLLLVAPASAAARRRTVVTTTPVIYRIPSIHIHKRERKCPFHLCLARSISFLPSWFAFTLSPHNQTTLRSSGSKRQIERSNCQV
uniref:Putative secreted protein n=1 Tax=Anopheles triannulatus TaxID=58253 RepID=A0A2M4B738_9DIPT